MPSTQRPPGTHLWLNVCWVTTHCVEGGCTSWGTELERSLRIWVWAVADLKKEKEKNTSNLSFSRRGARLVFCGLDSVHILSVFRHDKGVVPFLTCPIPVTAWPCLKMMLLWHCLCSVEEHKDQWDSIRLAPGCCFSLSQAWTQRYFWRGREIYLLLDAL